ncbi:hotdog fold thioesterase [Nocardioides convexus]|uniref:hotdog fold thioesterase n=1 Tax=Nocardioides convexus TaxID=2712224 RepID=UPI0024181CAE|nr:hotdog fold thioesterase [Nocardioides convexus]
MEVDPERVVATMPVEGNTQPYGLLHGGASVVLAETLGSVAAALHAGPDRFAVGTDINATHHRSATSGVVTGVATPLHRGRTMASLRDRRQRRGRSPGVHLADHLRAAGARPQPEGLRTSGLLGQAEPLRARPPQRAPGGEHLAPATVGTRARALRGDPVAQQRRRRDPVHHHRGQAQARHEPVRLPRGVRDGGDDVQDAVLLRERGGGLHQGVTDPVATELVEHARVDRLHAGLEVERGERGDPEVDGTGHLAVVLDDDDALLRRGLGGLDDRLEVGDLLGAVGAAQGLAPQAPPGSARRRASRRGSPASIDSSVPAFLTQDGNRASSCGPGAHITPRPTGPTGVSPSWRATSRGRSGHDRGTSTHRDRRVLVPGPVRAYSAAMQKSRVPALALTAVTALAFGLSACAKDADTTTTKSGVKARRGRDADHLHPPALRAVRVHQGRPDRRLRHRRAEDRRRRRGSRDEGDRHPVGDDHHRQRHQERRLRRLRRGDDHHPGARGRHGLLRAVLRGDPGAAGQEGRGLHQPRAGWPASGSRSRRARPAPTTSRRTCRRAPRRSPSRTPRS